MVYLLLLWISFDPNPIVFIIPFINHPIAWYGCIFSFSFYLGYKLFIWMHIRHSLNTLSIPDKYTSLIKTKEYILSKKNKHLYNFFKKRCKNQNDLEKVKLRLYLEQTYPKDAPSIQKKSTNFSESGLLYIILATVIGARLGHILFYENITEFLLSPSNIFKTWEGGLASHGGIIAILISAYIFVKKSKTCSYLTFMDLLSIPTMFVCAFIRIGNLINQEVLGSPTTLPWGVLFLNPADGSSALPRHPMQLYEFLLYFTVFVFSFFLWKKNVYKEKTGFYLGFSLVISFTGRFFLEFLKTPQSIYDSSLPLQIGQVLSIPMIAIGLILLYKSLKKEVNLDKKTSEH